MKNLALGLLKGTSPLFLKNIHSNTFCSFSFLLKNKSRKYTHFSPPARVGFEEAKALGAGVVQLADQSWIPRLFPLEKGGTLSQPSQDWAWEIKIWATRTCGRVGGPQVKQRWPSNWGLREQDSACIGLLHTQTPVTLTSSANSIFCGLLSGLPPKGPSTPSSQGSPFRH